MKISFASIPFLVLSFSTPLAVAPVSAADAAATLALEQKARKGGSDRTFSSLDRPDASAPDEVFPAGLIKFTDADIGAVLAIYQEISHRTVIRPSALPAVKITIESSLALSRRGVLQALDTVLAQNGIAMIPQGATYVKAVPQAQAPMESAPIPDLTPDQLPESGSYMTYIVDLKGGRASDTVMVLQPFAKMPNSIIALDEVDMLILRDYSANIRRMLQVLDKVERARKARHTRPE